MAKGYIVARVSVNDPDAYMEYIKNARIAMDKYGATILWNLKPSTKPRCTSIHPSTNQHVNTAPLQV